MIRAVRRSAALALVPGPGCRLRRPRPRLGSPSGGGWDGAAFQDADVAASIKVRGSSSARENQKKSYNIKMRDAASNAKLQARSRGRAGATRQQQPACKISWVRVGSWERRLLALCSAQQR